MNVLIFVMTMLMILASITYAKLDAFRGARAFQTVYEEFMQKDERGMINARAEKVYDSVVINTKDGTEKPRNSGTARIGIKLFVDKQARIKGDEWSQTKILFKNLLDVLYQDQPFYQDLAAKRSSFVDEIIEELVQSIDELPREMKPKTAADLANIRLPDPQLDKALYFMLRGAPYKQIGQPQQSDQRSRLEEGNQEEVEPDTTTPEDQKLEEEEMQEHVSSKGYYSLLDFVTLSAPPKVRIYLAPREVLMAIFLDPRTVDSVIQERAELHKQAKAGSDVKELGTKFKNEFERYKDPLIDEKSLDFSVSKTRPKK